MPNCTSIIDEENFDKFERSGANNGTKNYMKLHYNHINLIFVMRFDKVLLFSKLTFSCHVKNKMLMQLEKDSEPIGSKYLKVVKLKNNLFKNSYQKM